MQEPIACQKGVQARPFLSAPTFIHVNLTETKLFHGEFQLGKSVGRWDGMAFALFGTSSIGTQNVIMTSRSLIRNNGWEHSRSSASSWLRYGSVGFGVSYVFFCEHIACKFFQRPQIVENTSPFLGAHFCEKKKR